MTGYVVHKYVESAYPKAYFQQAGNLVPKIKCAR